MVPDDSVLDKIPRNLVKRHSFLPLFVDDDVLIVACIHEATPDLEEELRLRYGVPMRPVLATPLAINQGITKYYAPGMRDEAAEEEQPASARDRKSKAGKTKTKPKSAAGDSAEEKRRQRMIAIVVVCWATIGSVVIDRFVIMPLIFGPKAAWFFPILGDYLLTLIVLPIVGWYVYQTYRK